VQVEAWLRHNSEEPMTLTLGPEDVEKKIERALAQFERGEFFSPEESRADMEKRKAAWLAKRRRS
jgi:hypothetical protein